jgi:hypothetical protein
MWIKPRALGMLGKSSSTARQVIPAVDLTGSYHLAQAGLELLILLPPRPTYWDFRYVYHSWQDLFLLVVLFSHPP